jgi:aminopeptidase
LTQDVCFGGNGELGANAADAVRSCLEADAGAVRLGEVALVDGTSPVGRSGRVFNRRAGRRERDLPHRAGNGYPFTLPDLPEDADERADRGFNVSAIHQDVVIGGPEIAVDGIDRHGTATPMLRDVVWLLE